MTASATVAMIVVVAGVTALPAVASLLLLGAAIGVIVNVRVMLTALGYPCRAA